MSYLRGTEINEIANDVRLLSIDEIDDISHYLFDSKVKEYNIFLEVALKFFDLNISKTFLLIHKNNSDTPEFYYKNGFVENLSNKTRNPGFGSFADTFA